MRSAACVLLHGKPDQGQYQTKLEYQGRVGCDRQRRGRGRVRTTIRRVSNDRVRPVKEMLVRIVAMLNRLVPRIITGISASFKLQPAACTLSLAAPSRSPSFKRDFIQAGQRMDGTLRRRGFSNSAHRSFAHWVYPALESFLHRASLQRCQRRSYQT